MNKKLIIFSIIGIIILISTIAIIINFDNIRYNFLSDEEKREMNDLYERANKSINDYKYEEIEKQQVLNDVDETYQKIKELYNLSY